MRHWWITSRISAKRGAGRTPIVHSKYSSNTTSCRTMAVAVKPSLRSRVVSAADQPAVKPQGEVAELPSKYQLKSLALNRVLASFLHDVQKERNAAQAAPPPRACCTS